MSDRYDPAEAHRLRLARQTEGLDLFGPVWPERPPAIVEQRALPLDGSTAGLYATWRTHIESDTVLATLRRLALEWVGMDPSRSKIGPRVLWEAARRDMQSQHLARWCDNRLQALAVREVEDTTPELRGRFRHRVLKEAEAA